MPTEPCLRPQLTAFGAYFNLSAIQALCPKLPKSRFQSKLQGQAACQSSGCFPGNSCSSL